MDKIFLNKQHDNSFVEAPETTASYVAVPVKEMEKMEAEQADHLDHIAALQQILREKSNRERKVRPARTVSGYKVLSVNSQPTFRLKHLAQDKDVEAYMVTLDTPWSLAHVDMNTARKLWERDAEKVCKEYGFVYLPDDPKVKSRSDWKAGKYAFGGLLAADYVRRYEYTVSFISSKPPIIPEWELTETKKRHRS